MATAGKYDSARHWDALLACSVQCLLNAHPLILAQTSPYLPTWLWLFMDSWFMQLHVSFWPSGASLSHTLPSLLDTSDP
jgi:hypothetical protein